MKDELIAAAQNGGAQAAEVQQKDGWTAISIATNDGRGHVFGYIKPDPNEVRADVARWMEAGQ